jgi:hypothetical protein
LGRSPSSRARSTRRAPSTRSCTLGTSRPYRYTLEAQAVVSDGEARRVRTPHGGREKYDASKQEHGYRNEKPQVAALGRCNREYAHTDLRMLGNAQRDRTAIAMAPIAITTATVRANKTQNIPIRPMKATKAVNRKRPAP